MGTFASITVEALQRAVIEDFLTKAVLEETKVQGRPLTKNETTSFRRGIKYGINFDLFRNGDWEAAAAALRKA